MELRKFDRHYNSIDLCKLIMAFAVVAIHTKPLENCNNKYISNAYELVVEIAVPFFFLASGYLLSAKMKLHNNFNISFLEIKKQLIKIIRMYLIWTLIYCPLAIYHFFSSRTPLWKAVLMYIRGVVFIGESYNSWHLWYLLSTIYALIAVSAVLRFKKSSKALIILSIISSILSIGCSALVSYEENLPAGIVLYQKLIQHTIQNGRIFGGAIYIPVGMLLMYKEIPKIVNWLLFGGCIISNYFITNSAISSYLLIFTTIGLFGIVKRIELRDNVLFEVMRNMSTIIYLIHMYIWTFYYTLCYGEKTWGTDSFIVTALCSSIVAYIYAIGNIVYRINLHKCQTSPMF